MHIVRFAAAGIETIESPDWETLLARQEGVLWVDMAGPDAEDQRVMREVFHFHPLAIEDTMNQRQRPKVEEYREHLFLIFNPVDAFKDDLSFRELDMFVMPHCVVTVHEGEREPVVGQVIQRCTARMDAGQTIPVGYLIYALADAVVDLYFPLLDVIGDEIESISEAIIAHPRREDLNRLFRLKRALAEMWRVVGQQRDMFNVFTRLESQYIGEEISRYYMRDIYDHLLRISDTVSTFRDTMSGVIDLYMSSVSNRLNVVVQRLTVVTIGVGVLTVISGFFGMNFEHTWPPFAAEWGVPFIVIIMVFALLIIGIVLWKLE
jgi:magnesium transporter